MKVFIDTNVYLSFFGVDPNLPALLEFKKLLKDKNSKVELIVTQQLFDEYERNVGSIMDMSRQQLAKEAFDLKLVAPEYLEKEFKNDINKIIEKAKLLKEKKLEKLEKSFLETEKVISEIFSLGINIPLTDEIILKAKERCDRGNPPRKIKTSPENNTSYGDAINWESILSSVNDNLIIISNDPDYAELFKKQKIINRFLKKEWNKKGKTIHLYTQLGIFINTLEKEPVIPKEAIEKEIRSSDLISIEKPLAYHILTTEERIFPLSGAVSNVFSTIPSFSEHAIRVDESGYLRGVADIGSITNRLQIESITDPRATKIERLDLLSGINQGALTNISKNFDITDILNDTQERQNNAPSRVSR